jgi:hypothetical protein
MVFFNTWYFCEFKPNLKKNRATEEAIRGQFMGKIGAKNFVILYPKEKTNYRCCAGKGQCLKG